MILPIALYGSPVLHRVAVEIDKDYPNLDKLIDDMFETMYKAEGVGLAAPQVGRGIRLFIVDTGPLEDSGERISRSKKDKSEVQEAQEQGASGYKEVFINPEIIEESDDDDNIEEGCLSIPGVREGVDRPEGITIRYLDRNFEEKTAKLNGFASRVVQHEYDHLEGILFTEYLSGFKKTLLKGKLDKIAKGQHSYVSYPTKAAVAGK